MLYVFHVDIGKKLTFDMRLLSESVGNLKNVIEQYCGIPVNKQVLLISGGESLSDSQKVCCYSAGTDTNPIYLFNKSLLEQSEVFWGSSDYKQLHKYDTELNQMFNAINSTAPPITLFTINKVDQLAQRYSEQANIIKSFCIQLNEDMLLQNQGWLAALANLDDLLNSFRNLCESFDSTYSRYLETRQESIEIVDRFENFFDILEKIPLFDALLNANEEEKARVEEYIRSKPAGSEPTLLDWITSKDPEQNLENIVHICKNAFIQYKEEDLLSLRNDINNIFSDDKIKELHDNLQITQRLTCVCTTLAGIDETYQNQLQRAAGIRRNHERAVAINDDCVLPDLFNGHKDAIQCMKDNHTNLKSFRQLCTKLKNEVCTILNKKLRTVMEIQLKVAEIRSFLILHNGNLKNLKQHIEIIQMLKEIPQKYVDYVTEVVRRNYYSKSFIEWSSNLSCHLFNIYTEEMKQRKAFYKEYRRDYFLNCLFPGMDDYPSDYGIHPPALFDNNLPGLCIDDLIKLRDCIANCNLKISIPDMKSIKCMLSSSNVFSLSSDEDDDNQISLTALADDKLAVVPAEMDEDNNDTRLSLTISDEKLPTDNDAIDKSTENTQLNDLNVEDDESTRPSSKYKEKKMDIIEHEKRLKPKRDRIPILGTNAMISLCNNFSILQDWVLSHQSDAITAVQSLQYRLHSLLRAVDEKDEKIKSLYVKISCLESELRHQYENLADSSEVAVARFQEELEKERERITKEVTERLVRDHKKELENLRCRFKLMTCAGGMERTSSESSLEKVDRGEWIELSNHELTIGQLKEEAKIQLEKAIVDERSACEIKLADQLKKYAAKFEEEKQMLVERTRTQILRECEKQTEILKNREEALLTEIQKQKDALHVLTGSEGGYSLVVRMKDLEREKIRLEAELIKERTSRYSFAQLSSPSTASLAFASSAGGDSGGSSTSLAGNSSPELYSNRDRCKDKVTCKKSRASSRYEGKISLNSCNVSDIVLVVWDEAQRNYTILQESSTPHFLHPSSIDTLGLEQISDGSPVRLYCPAEVIEKEYCAPRKTTNRYNMKEGERFYRVKVRPLLSVTNTN